ncbi:hypothetical protein E4T56_gene12093 [Termitomyces sp. T112]|nr:hypothetical protein E4T56_gene12093 [Termitomyces sp. T112]
MLYISTRRIDTTNPTNLLAEPIHSLTTSSRAGYQYSYSSSTNASRFDSSFRRGFFSWCFGRKFAPYSSPTDLIEYPVLNTFSPDADHDVLQVPLSTPPPLPLNRTLAVGSSACNLVCIITGPLVEVELDILMFSLVHPVLCVF